MHNRFHVALVAACGSEWLLRFRRTLLEQSERYRRLALMNRDMDRDLEAEHLALMTATLEAPGAHGASRARAARRLVRPHVGQRRRRAQDAAASGAPRRRQAAKRRPAD